MIFSNGYLQITRRIAIAKENIESFCTICTNGKKLATVSCIGKCTLYLPIWYVIFFPVAEVKFFYKSDAIEKFFPEYSKYSMQNNSTESEFVKFFLNFGLTKIKVKINIIKL